MTGCDGKTVEIRSGSCSGAVKDSCILADGSSCGAFFTDTQTDKVYYACIDKDDANGYNDPGEQASDTWKVGECDNDPDCGFSPTTHVQGKCDSPSGSWIPSSNDYLCKFGTCVYNTDCDSNYCCTYEGPTNTLNPGPDYLSGECKPLGDIQQPNLCTQ